MYFLINTVASDEALLICHVKSYNNIIFMNYCFRKTKKHEW